MLYYHWHGNHASYNAGSIVATNKDKENCIRELSAVMQRRRADDIPKQFRFETASAIFAEGLSSLIEPDIVLSTAHCIQSGGKYKAVIGRHILDTSHGDEVNVKTGITHPG